MPLTSEEKNRRRNDERVKYITERICRYDSGKPYVFVSYKSDEWEKVLGDIVYKLVHDYGLNVYFDGDFNGHNPLWTKQFPENMEADDCRGILAFVDDLYTTSYATLIELLYSQVGCQDSRPPYNDVKKPVVTINLGKLTIIYDKSDTGLGTKVYENGEANLHWKAEKDLFDELFRKAEKEEIIRNTVKPYKKSEGSLSKELCSAMSQEILASIGSNDNFIDDGINLEDIVHTIESVCGQDVFTPPKKEISEGIGPGESTVGAGQSSGYAGGGRTGNTQILEETGYPEWPYAVQPPAFKEYWEGFRRYLQDSKLDPKLKPAGTAGDYSYYNVFWSSKIYIECAVNKSSLRVALIVHETEKFQQLQEHREEIDQAIKKLGESAWKEDSKAKNFHVHIPVADLDVKAHYSWFRQGVETIYDVVKDWLQ